MQRALNLPRGAKEELNYGPEIAEKAAKGEPLWDEAVKEEGEDGDEDAEAAAGGDEEGAEKLSDD